MGGGWGTIAGVRLRVLVLADPDRGDVTDRIARALDRHSVHVLSDPRGALSSHVAAAKAARQTRPDIVHGVGARGFGAAAAPIARGMGVRLVVSLGDPDLRSSKPKKLARLANAADAVVLSDEGLVPPLRAAGLARSVYVVPDDALARPLEVIYGRLLDRELGEPGRGECDLVQIGPFER
jgi:hypothetical protein